MAYLHCHNCPWSQDDFYQFIRYDKYRKRFRLSYSPIKRIFSSFRCWGYPKYIEMDSWWAKENGFRNPIFTWRILFNDLIRIWRSAAKMKWWTYKSFKKEKNKACPKCGSKKLDID